MANKPKASTPAPEVMMYTLDEAAATLRVGRTTLRALIREGHLHTVYIGNRPLVRRRDLMDYIDRLADAS